MEKIFISADSLLRDSLELGVQWPQRRQSALAQLAAGEDLGRLNERRVTASAPVVIEIEDA